MFLALRPPAFHWRTLRESEGGEEAGGVEGNQEQWAVLREQRGKIQNGPMGVRSLRPRVGRVCSISRRRARLYGVGIQVGGVQGESHSVTSGDTAGEQLQE